MKGICEVKDIKHVKVAWFLQYAVDTVGRINRRLKDSFKRVIQNINMVSVYKTEDRLVSWFKIFLYNFYTTWKIKTNFGAFIFFFFFF